MDQKKEFYRFLLCNINAFKLLIILLFFFSFSLFKVVPKAYAGASVWYDKSTTSTYQPFDKAS